MQEGDDVMFEIDFLEKRILYICPQCKHNNQLLLQAKDKSKNESSGLPPMSVFRG